MHYYISEDLLNVMIQENRYQSISTSKVKTIATEPYKKIILSDIFKYSQIKFDLV